MATIQGRAVPPALLGPLREFDAPSPTAAEDPALQRRLREALAADGYLLLRGALDRAEVRTTRIPPCATRHSGSAPGVAPSARAPPRRAPTRCPPEPPQHPRATV
jgi:hypothetical protein